MRPLVLICNDVYAPSLRPLRQSGLAEIVHVGKPSIDAVVTRLKSVFEREGIPCEKDAARKLCEAAWGMTSGIDAKRGAEGNAEGDLRGVMVVGEWVASRLKAAASTGHPIQLTRQWVEKNIIQDLAHGGGGARGLGRGGTKEIVSRIFQEGAGFPKQILKTDKNFRDEQPAAQLSFSEQQKKYAAVRLAEMIETCGEMDRIMTEIFLEYPNREFNDDSFLTKPDVAYEWLHFHDTCTKRLYSGQEWELAPYLSQPALACHHLFASPKRHVPETDGRKWGDVDENAPPPVPFSGARADFEAREAEKVNRAMLQSIQASLPPTLHRAFRSPEHVASDFLPYLVRLVSPDVKPVVVGGGSDKGSVASVRREGERAMVKRAAGVLAEVGIRLIKGRIEEAGGGVMGRTQWVYRMEP
jgi:chromosome transmission fidelity protein 18